MKSVQKKPVLQRTLDNIIRFNTSIGETSEFTGNFSGGYNNMVRETFTGVGSVRSAVVSAVTGR